MRPRKTVGSSVLTLKDLYLDVSVKVLDVAQDPVDGLFEFGFSPYEWHGGQEVQKRKGVVSVDIVSSIIPSVYRQRDVYSARFSSIPFTDSDLRIGMIPTLTSTRERFELIL